MRGRVIGAWVSGLLLMGCTAAVAVPVPSPDPCQALYSSNTIANLQKYEKCRLDRIETAIPGNQTVTKTATVTATVTAAPSTVTVTATPTVTTPAATSTPASSTPASTAASSTPASTPVSSTPPAPAGCVGAANTPGGADPWGGCWPGPQNTGYPKGLPGDTRAPVTLTAYTGPTTIRTCGVVIDSKIVGQDILVEASNGTDLTKPCVTIKNSLVKGVVFAEARTHGPVLIQDTEVVPDGLSWWENIGRSNFTALRVNSHGSQGVIKCDDNCVARDNWVHGMELGKAYHYNAFGGNGSSNFRIEHNWASCGDWSSVEAGVQGDAGCSAAIGFYGDFAQNQDITIHRNFLTSNPAGATPADDWRQAAYCLNPGYYPGKPFPNTARITVTDNVFARGTTGKCGVYGPSNSLNKVGAPNGNVWSGNRFVDGEVIARPEE